MVREIFDGAVARVSSLEIPDSHEIENVPQTADALARALSDMWASGSVEGEEEVSQQRKDKVASDLIAFFERTTKGSGALDASAANGAVDNWEYVFPPIAVKDARKGLHQLVKDSPLTRNRFLSDAVSAEKYHPTTREESAAVLKSKEAEEQASAAFAAQQQQGVPPPQTGEEVVVVVKKVQPRPLLHCVRLVLKSALGRSELMSTEAKKSKNYDPRGTKKQWPGVWKDYVHFTLCKMNMDTISAINTLSRSLWLTEDKVFSYAGTKDKRAISMQRCSAYRLDPARLDSAINHGPRHIQNNMLVGNYTFSDSPISLGDHSGNRFTVVLKNIQHHHQQHHEEGGKDEAVAVTSLHDAVTVAVENLRRSGFVNYFGLQRFGTGSVPTPVIGKALLQGKWALVIDMIVGGWDTSVAQTQTGGGGANKGSSSPAAEEDALMAKAVPAMSTRAQSSPCYAARCKWKETKDAWSTLQLMPRWMTAECSVLEGLVAKGSGQPLEALRFIPYKLLMLYLHSYQSLVWNQMATARLMSLGKREVVVGDLVVARKREVLLSDTTADDTAAGAAATSTPSDALQASGRPQTAVQNRFTSLHVVDENDIKENKYSMTDVVLPVPGTDVQYPLNMADAYSAVIEGDGIQFNKNPHWFPSLTGDYRYCVQKPAEVEHSIVSYSDHNESLTETELTPPRCTSRDQHEHGRE